MRARIISRRLPARSSAVGGSGVMLDNRVQGWKERALVAIAPPHKVRGRAVVAMNFQNHGLAVPVTHMVPSDDQPIVDACSHRSSFVAT
jgi:hypothetical protein